MRTPKLLPRKLLNAGVTISLTALVGCSGANYLDPYQKPYTWHPTGAAAANIAAQVVDPRDLVAGHGTNREDTQESTLAIQHIWLDTPKPLGTTSGGSGGGSSGSGSGPSASGGGPGASGGSAGGSGGSSGGSN